MTKVIKLYMVYNFIIFPILKILESWIIGRRSKTDEGNMSPGKRIQYVFTFQML